MVDQDQTPVQSASIEFQWTDVEGEAIRSQAKTDQTGLFSITGIQSKALTVRVSKEGYSSSNQLSGTRFLYADSGGREIFRPDQRFPVLFQLRKRTEAEPLIHGQKLFAFRPNGPVQHIDLMQGRSALAASADLAVKFTRGTVGTDNKYDWSAVIGVPEGGILEAAGDLTAEAPIDGYQAVVEIRHDAASPEWRPEVKRTFYIKSRGGQVYARLEATIIPYYQQNAALDVHYYLNPNASRKLEYDPQKEIKPGGSGNSVHDPATSRKQTFYE